MTSARVYIQIPEDIEIELDIDRMSIPPITRKERCNFQRFFLAYLLDEPTVFGTVAGIMDAVEIQAAFAKDASGKPISYPDVVALPVGLFDKLKKAMEARKFEGTVWRFLVKFFLAIKMASDKDPRGAAAPVDEQTPPS